MCERIADMIEPEEYETCWGNVIIIGHISGSRWVRPIDCGSVERPNDNTPICHDNYDACVGT